MGFEPTFIPGGRCLVWGLLGAVAQCAEKREALQLIAMMGSNSPQLAAAIEASFDAKGLRTERLGLV